MSEPSAWAPVWKVGTAGCHTPFETQALNLHLQQKKKKERKGGGERERARKKKGKKKALTGLRRNKSVTKRLADVNKPLTSAASHIVKAEVYSL